MDLHSRNQPVAELHLVDPPGLCLDEIAAWLDEVEPILRAVHRRTGPSSAGLLRWSSDQMAFVADIASWSEEVAFEVEALEEDGSLFDVAWLCTRIGAALSMMRDLAGRRLEAA